MQVKVPGNIRRKIKGSSRFKRTRPDYVKPETIKPKGDFYHTMMNVIDRQRSENK